MDFEWDDSKAEDNYSQHGVDFVDATRVFLDPNRIERLDTSRDYGEDRYQTIGFVEDAILFVVYTERGERLRLISARRATLRERDAYGHETGR